MNNENVTNVHWSFWAIGIITLIWNVMGVINFIVQMDADMVAAMPETHRAIIEVRPAWATGAFALAVFGGAIGCIFLMLKKSISYYIFIASLLGVIITMIPHFNLIGSTINDPFEIVMMIIMPFVVAAFLIWYAKQAMSKDWIKQEH